MQLFLQQVIEGLTAGAIYASLALALVLVYRATRVVNFAQGEMGTLTAYLVWQLFNWGVPFILAVLIVAPISFVIGALVFRLMIRPVLSSDDSTKVVICIGLFIGFEAICLWIWGPDAYAFPTLFPSYAWEVGGLRFSATNIGILAVLCLMAACVAALFQYTRFGLAMRASAAEREKSPLVGIRVETMLMAGWGLASVCGFVAAVLVAPRLFISPPMMVGVVIYALAAATLGGWDSPFGAIVGGLTVGVAESLAATYIGFIGSELKISVPFVVMAVILIARPQGLFGKRAVIRV